MTAIEATESSCRTCLSNTGRHAACEGRNCSRSRMPERLGRAVLTPGIPDLGAYGGDKLNGRTLYIELKTRRGKLYRTISASCSPR